MNTEYTVPPRTAVAEAEPGCRWPRPTPLRTARLRPEVPPSCMRGDGNTKQATVQFAQGCSHFDRPPYNKTWMSPHTHFHGRHIDTSTSVQYIHLFFSLVSLSLETFTKIIVSAFSIMERFSTPVLGMPEPVYRLVVLGGGSGSRTEEPTLQ